MRRERLLDQLDRGLAYPLILVSAPPGFGKTTLVAGWLETCSWPCAWLALDEADSDPAAFLAYFLAAVRSMFPDALQATMALPGGQPSQALAPTVANDLDQIAQPFILVLDDYQAIHNPAVHALLEQLLRHPPQPMHLVLISRQDPPLPLGPLRARNQLAEIRARDLRFTTTEIAAFVQGALGALPDDRGLAILEDKTEGWVAGLRLATLALQYAGHVGTHLSELNADNRYAMDYFLAEVLVRQTPALQDFLLKTSILDRLSAPLCDAVTGSADAECDGQTYLHWLDAANLFITPLDEQGHWYRYHHLFRQLLHNELERRYGPAEIAACHARAAAWLAAAGLIDDALNHALAAGDIPAAVQLVARHRHALMNQEQWCKLEGWLELFPPQAVEEDPDLLMLQAWVLETRGRSTADSHILDRVQAAAERQPVAGHAAAVLEGEIAALRSERCYYGCDPEGALAFGNRALEITPPEHYLVRSYATLFIAGARQMAGDLRGAHLTVQQGLTEDRSHSATSFARMLSSFAVLHWIAGNLPEMKRVARHVHDSTESLDLPDSAAWAHYWLGIVAYQQDDLAEAERNFAAVLARPEAAHGYCSIQSAIGQALTQQALRRPAKAREVIESTVASLMSAQSFTLARLGMAFQAELGLMQGNLAAATSWAAGPASTPRLSAASQLYMPQLTLPKVLLAENTPASRARAAALLAELRSFLSTIHNTRFLIETLALQARLDNLAGNEPAALATLGEAVGLAQPGGFIRLFVDMGPDMARLLSQLNARSSGPITAYIAAILRAFVNARMPAPPPQPADLATPLTQREMEILALLADRWSNNEIAEKLVIAPQTVKRHTLNIYQKLQVDGRRTAVARAESLGLLVEA